MLPYQDIVSIQSTSRSKVNLIRAVVLVVFAFNVLVSYHPSEFKVNVCGAFSGLPVVNDTFFIV